MSIFWIDSDTCVPYYDLKYWDPLLIVVNSSTQRDSALESKFESVTDEVDQYLLNALHI